MPNNLIGKEHNTLLEWFLNYWMTGSASPVCFLEGFSGTGKTTLARMLLEKVINEKLTAVMITAPETEKDPTDDILLDLAAELSSAGRSELVNAIENNRALLDVLSNLVNEPILIIIDEFQRTMQGPRSIPLGGFAKVLSRLANRKWLKGRILLLTNRLVERARWSEPYVIRTLKGMKSDDAISLLEYFAREDGRIDEIDLDRRHEIVKWVGGNPRAIRLIVKNLAYDSLNDLIGFQPESWELQEREVSPELVEDLEREILKKTLSQLSDSYIYNLHCLSVIRKPFKRQAIELLFKEKADYASFKQEMIGRFLIEQYKGWFNLHPIAREIALQKLAESPEEKRKIHALIAPYYMRHFRAKQIVGWGSLGGHFVEARYHLIKAEKSDELREIASRFQNYIFNTLSNTSPIPNNPEELDERIAVLSSLLVDPGPKKLEYHLARLFQRRNQRNDLNRALNHAYRARSNYHVESWFLCSELLSQMKRDRESIKILYQGIKCVPPDKGLAILYDRCSQILYEQNCQEEAIKILKEGIMRIPPDKALVSLYERCGRFQYQMGEIEKAINTLKEGMEKIPPDKALVTLYTLCSNILSQSGQYGRALDIIKRGIKCIPPDKAVSDLYYKAGELLIQNGQNQEAISILKEGIKKIPYNKGACTVYTQCCELLFKGGELADAIKLAEDGIKHIPYNKGASLLYLQYIKLLLMSNQIDKAINILQDAIIKIPSKQNQSLIELLLIIYAACFNEAEIIKLIREHEESLDAHYVTAQVLLYQIQQSWEKAANYAQEAIQKRIKNNILPSMEAFSWLCAGQPKRGLQVISNQLIVTKRYNFWLEAFIHLRLDNIGKAKQAITNYINQLPALQYIDEIFLLNLWDRPSEVLEQYDLAYYFPILPTSLTGLQHPVSRIPYSPPIGIKPNVKKRRDKMVRVFISHSSVQKADADDLHFMLTQAGYEPILDSYDISGGQSIPKRIEELISECDYFILLLTKESIRSAWVQAEITLAYTAGLLKEERLLPVQINDIDEHLANSIPWIPRNSYNWLDGTKGLRPVVEWLDKKRKMS